MSEKSLSLGRKKSLPLNILFFHKLLDSTAYNNDQILETIKECKEKTGYTVCPHTAIGVRYHFEHPTE
jgi:threonine synthase